MGKMCLVRLRPGVVEAKMLRGKKEETRGTGASICKDFSFSLAYSCHPICSQVFGFFFFRPFSNSVSLLIDETK